VDWTEFAAETTPPPPIEDAVRVVVVAVAALVGVQRLLKGGRKGWGLGHGGHGASDAEGGLRGEGREGEGQRPAAGPNAQADGQQLEWVLGRVVHHGRHCGPTNIDGAVHRCGQGGFNTSANQQLSVKYHINAWKSFKGKCSHCSYSKNPQKFSLLLVNFEKESHFSSNKQSHKVCLP